ncbi:ABC transporter permease [Methylococcus geothermalis]|uniref:ABC transporter permease subunit n=1 Tax=Methylococcus geothermalis TaxID=2681310 RepID=A0A858Q8Y6_9GAMM|nr:ABC transporter permease [Methylococcus geothermalis]QJD30261.1 ABC transporter permease subunit [Methylococcus geothermalis]
MLTLFWTDALFLLLLAMLGGLIWQTRRHEHLRRPWRKVARSRSAMISAVILVVYLLIAVLDSIHFLPRDGEGGARFKTEPVSALDWCLTPLRTRVEKTYSAPLAVHGYARENLRLPDGSTRWDYPRLKYGGAQLKDPARSWLGDVLRTGLKGAADGFGLGTILGLGIVALIARVRGLPFSLVGGEVLSGQSEIPWRAMLGTVIALCVGGGVLAELSLKYHVFGTDKVGEDVLYQSLKSIRTGILIGTLTTFVTLPLSLLLGILAGYFRGWVDDVIQYVYTTLNSIPGVLLIAAVILLTQVYMAKHEDDFASLALRADLRLLFLCLILGITSWTGLCRLLRAETLKLREMEYVQAARALGVRQGTILLRHILPNVFHIVLISVALDFSSLVLAEAVLSYVNIGVDPTTDSWGNMINGARLEMAREPPVWWSLTAAFAFMFALVLAANLFADAVRDAFDPRRAD